MSDLKSKLPDLKEIASMTSKLFKDLKNSVTEIIDDYKEKHLKDEASDKPETEKTNRPKAGPSKSETTTGTTQAKPKETTTKTSKPEASVSKSRPSKTADIKSSAEAKPKQKTVNKTKPSNKQ